MENKVRSCRSIRERLVIDEIGYSVRNSDVQAERSAERKSQLSIRAERTPLRTSKLAAEPPSAASSAAGQSLATEPRKPCEFDCASAAIHPHGNLASILGAQVKFVHSSSRSLNEVTMAGLDCVNEMSRPQLTLRKQLNEICLGHSQDLH